MSSNTKRRILVVDDEPVIRLFLQELFEDEGYEVVTAESIAEGLAALKRGGLNLVVTDKNLPDGTGFEIVHAAKASDPPCEAMIVTGYASLDSAVMALQIGAYDYILKPIEDVDLLLEKARKAIEKQDLWRELHELRARLDAQDVAAAAARDVAAATARDVAAAAARDVAAAKAEPKPSADMPAALRQLEEQIAGGLPQLMKLAELGSLMPMLAHEMRQPLAGVKGYVDLLMHKKDVAENVKTKLVSVQEQVAHLSGLLESITSYARVSQNGDQLMDLSRAVQLALSIFPVLRARGRYEFSCDIAEDLPPMRGNVNAVQQVVVNLLKNAKDALDDKGGGRLSLTATFDDAAGELALRVEDAGPGIPDDVRCRLFTPFFTTKKEGVGTGLGLSICRQIVEDHGGRIDVESPVGPDGGTAFTIRFPAVVETVGAGAGRRA
jgi:signal transduction histidine kinase